MYGYSLTPQQPKFIPEESLNKYLLDIPNSEFVADVESFHGEEALSEPYRYCIRFTSNEADVAAASLLKKSASFRMRGFNPDWSSLIQTANRWTALRQICGVITSLERISTSVDETLYEAVLEHPLALLDTRLRCAIYQDMSVPEVVKSILKEHRFEGYEINFDSLNYIYPRREMIVQWRETDLAFIRRLLAEVGIWFRFEAHPEHADIVVIVFGDLQTSYLFDHKITAANPSGNVAAGYSIQNLVAKHVVVPGSVDVRNYSYVSSKGYHQLDQQADSLRDEDLTHGGEYHYGDIHLEGGDRWKIGKNQQAETSWHYAKMRNELALNGMTILTATTDDPSIVPGTEVKIEGAIPQAFINAMVVTRMRLSGSRQSSFQCQLTGIPYNERVCFRPARIARPVISGTIPARISGKKLNDQLARIDNLGRYRVHFDFDKADWKKGLESMPVRLGRQYAGDRYGIHFPLQDNTEVGIGFQLGDPERPYIAHAFHDEINPDLVTDFNSTRNVIRTLRNNKLRMEDKAGKEHIKLATEYGKSQLNLGHLVNAQGEPRGEGVELRTDKQAALRSAESFHITTERQTKAAGQQNDMAATIAQLVSALQLARSLAASAEIADTPAADLSSVTELRQHIAEAQKPTLSMHGEAGVTVTSPASVMVHAGEDLASTAKRDMNINTFRRLTMAAGDVFSVLVRKAGMVFTAAKGPIKLTAQQGEITQVASQDINLTSSQGRIVLNAQKELLLMCGGAGIRLMNGRVEVIAPGDISFKTQHVAYMSQASIDQVKPSFNEGQLAQQFRLHAPNDPGHILTQQRFRLHRKGEVIEGITDDQGESPLLNSSELDTWSLEILHDNDSPEGTA